ncbi:CRISPR-associated protein Csx19 [Sphaerospermopsis sp. LEGE 08334]|uniref:type III-D CRISPR-associated protein Csx19 n=1 Tax=Sphaerospermopsis sp. LEGE 08334 TaxID=1828651 RepID=UPI001880F285|nr:CRISPR-associated protein Csx19 [Sphaerospermopsis sp. LEGE 08334]MBE9055642.1 TIGR03984 family CRISPR-associated protein [Sphaerospermopsis sp. LEGE 08334]
MVTLYGRCTQKNITLNSALEKCASALSNAVAIIYSPTSCQFAKVQENGHLANANNQILSLDKVFELRAFNQNCELRWLNELNGEGKAVLISEQNISDYLDENIAEIEILDTIHQQYILWGDKAKTESSSGWCKLSTARIGSIDVPVQGLTANERVYLNAVEYLKVTDENGNVSVVEERLTGLEVK